MTNVPTVTFGPNGFLMPTEEQILAGTLEDVNAAFGGALNPALNTPQGQLSTSMAALVASADETFLFYTTQTDPAFAVGRMQDAIARIYFLTRNPAEPTTLQILCTGNPGVLIPLNSLIQDNAGNTYTCTGSGVIGLGGTVTLSFANLVPGPIAVPGAGSVTIYQAIPGWDSVAVSSGVVGVNTETQSQFETRRAASVAINSVGSLASIRGAVLAVPGVLDAYVTENATGSTVTSGGTVLVPNSLYVAVSGGSAADVARAIWSKKAPGCAYNGNTTIVVTDSNSGYSPPYPTYNVSFFIPSGLAVVFSVTIKNSAAVPANALVLIQNALLAAFAGGTFGGATIPKAAIGSNIYALQYVPVITQLGAWAQVTNLQIGSANTASAQFTGSCGGTTMHVVSVISGTLGSGDYLVSGSAVSGTAVVNTGMTIVAQVSGTVGGTGFYTVSQSQTFPLQTIFDVKTNQSLVSVNINQEPSLAAADIGLTLT